MKPLLLSLAILLSLAALASDRADTIVFGENPGYYNGTGATTSHTNPQIIDLMAAAGCNSTRVGPSIQQWAAPGGLSPYISDLLYGYNTRGFRSNVLLLYGTAFTPVYPGQSDSMAGPNRSILPTGIWLAPFNADGSINRSNGWAAYCYDMVQAFGATNKYFEIWNEPDQTNSVHSFEDSTQDAGSWQNHEPLAADLTTMYASLEDYVQLCKIANQVIKKYQPAALICTGGIGSSWFYSWFLKKGGGQWVDRMSFHSYPYYAWVYCVWDPPINACGPTGGKHRYSDYLLDLMDSAIKAFRTSATALGETPKPMLTTEFNTPRWTFDDSTTLGALVKRWGNSHVNRNFLQKAIPFLYITEGLEYVCSYQAGETADSGSRAQGEISSMGLYKNLMRFAPGTEVLTPQGQAVQTEMHYIHNYVSDPVQPAGVPSSVRAFRFDSAGNKIYIAWAITSVDESEAASATYTLPLGAHFREILFDGSIAGTVSGTITLSGDPVILVQLAPAVPTFITSFTGSEQKNYNALAWNIETTDIISAITLQRSTDGINFQDITTLPASAKNYNDYTIDNSYYYRLVITGEGKTLAISEIVYLARPGIILSITPNPFKNYFQITVTNNAEIVVYTVIGQLVTRKYIAAGTSAISVHGAPGNYIVKVVSKNNVVTKMLVKL